MWDNLGPNNYYSKKNYWIIKFCIGQHNFVDPFLAAQEGQYSYKLSSWSAFDCSLCGLDRAKPTVQPFRLTVQAVNLEISDYVITWERAKIYWVKIIAGSSQQT